MSVMLSKYPAYYFGRLVFALWLMYYGAEVIYSFFHGLLVGPNPVKEGDDSNPRKVITPRNDK